MAPALILRTTPSQGLHRPIDGALILDQRIDSAEGGISELVGVGQAHFEQAALLIRSPHRPPPVRPVRLRGCTA